MSETTQPTAPTPGPWRIGRNPSALDEFYGANSEPVGFCDTGTPEIDRANAAHIVQCVNAYPDLVAALKAVPWDPWATENEQARAMCKWWDEIGKPALSKAGA